MSKSLKIILIAVGGLVGLLVLIALALLFFVDANTYKPRVEKIASEALGMEVQVGGRLSFGFLPGLHVTLEDVRARNRGADIVIAKQVRLRIDLLPLLQQQVRISQIALKQPRFTIERDVNGTFNFEKPDATAAALPVLNLPSVSIAGGSLQYADKQSVGTYEAKDCNLDVKQLRLAGRKSQDFLKSVSFKTQIACGELRKDDFTLTDVKFSANAMNGIFDLDTLSMLVFGGNGLGNLRVDFSGIVPNYQVHYSLAQFQSEEFIQALTSDKSFEGPMDFSADLSMQGKTLQALQESTEGQITLRGENIVLNGQDFDAVLSRFESSQNFNLVDVGAYFFAGPLGLAVTKGYNFASILQPTGGHSEIRMLVSDWKLVHGTAQAQDVAMATKKYRIALHGGLDIANQRFDNLIVAVIDAKGCAMVQQKIHGSFQKPVLEKPNVIKTLSGPALSLLKKGEVLLPGGACKAFYTGSVPPPQK
jgi:hypothetical protein